MKNNKNKYLENEGEMLKLCKHKHVVSLVNSFKYNNDYYIYMEMADKGDLQDYLDKVIKKLPKTEREERWNESSVLEIFVQLLKGLEYIHDQEVIHRDIKGKNILLYDNNLVKFWDFGVAKKGNLATTQIGSQGYMAADVLGEVGYTKEVDIFSLGVLLYYMIYFENFKRLEDGKAVWKKLDEIKKPDWISKDLFNIMIKMLNSVSQIP